MCAAAAPTWGRCPPARHTASLASPTPNQGDKMGYTVAVDSTGRAAQALMGAAGVSGIPHAFVIGERVQ